jgi:hypothetical protein
VWSHLRHADPLLVWFRGLLREVAGPAYADHRQRAARRPT